MRNYFILTFIYSLLFCSSLVGQITIAPTNIFIDDNSKFGTYMIINSSNQAQEISIDFFFGYYTTDNENGDRKLITDDSLTSKQYSINEYLRAFPQNFILNPGQRQVVRIRVNAPNTLLDRTYWARIKTTSSPETPPIEVQTTNAVNARVGIKIEQVTGLFYKSGNVSTGIEVEAIRSKLDENNIRIFTDYKRTGNSPFLGSITATILDKEGKIVSENFISTSLYFDGTHVQDLPIDNLDPGDYTVKVTFETSRSDISADDLIKMTTVSESSTITIP